MQQPPKPRMFFIDNLRTLLIVLVILQHLAITYGAPTGIWYIHEGTVELPTGFVYVFFLAANQAFFMGLLFLFAGYFTPGSYDRKGPGLFIADRALRLTIPIPIFIFIVDPLMKYALEGFQGFLPNLFLASPLVGLGFGPLWFIEALFYFSTIYLVWRVIKPSPTKNRPFPRNTLIALFGLLLASTTFALRTVLPIGYTFDLLGFQIPFFPQYIALFLVGLMAFRSNWILNIPKDTGRLWGRIAVVLLLLMPLLFIVGSIGFPGLGPFGGGWTWQALAFAFWEQFFCITVAIGLTVWFREKVNFQNRLTKAMAESSYGAYLLQAPILVYMTVALKGLEMPLLLKFVLLSPVAVGLCFGAAFFLRKIPKADRIL